VGSWRTDIDGLDDLGRGEFGIIDVIIIIVVVVVVVVVVASTIYVFLRVRGLRLNGLVGFDEVDVRRGPFVNEPATRIFRREGDGLR